MTDPISTKKTVGEIQLSRLQFPEEIRNLTELAKLVTQFSTQNTSDFLEVLLIGAIDLGASDVHFENEEEHCRIRLRIDGILQDLLTISHKNYQALLSRLKFVSGIKLNVSDRPQDGRFSVLDGRDNIEIRSSTLPAEYGEALVLRILNPRSLISMKDLGLRKDLLETFCREIAKPNGMIIVTGPTGSGKTTTLYAFLKRVQTPEIKIITIEDPIEYHLEGISQTQVDPAKGYTFASGLRAIVRQDPDVILVGEIRDLETAEIALQASLTGHLVFSTLHTNDAAGTVARLIDLKASPASIASAINMAVAQRLVRKVCPKCRVLETLSPVLREKIATSLKNVPADLKVPLGPEAKVPIAKGCADCGFTGYRGRLGVFEAFLIDEEMEKFILEKPSTSSLKQKAISQGMVTLYQSGLLRVLEGLTTIEEIDKVIGTD